MTGVVPAFLGQRLNDLEYRHAVFLLETAVNNGWSIEQMAEGFADVFTDETGITTKTNMTFAAGQYGNAGNVLIDPAEGTAFVDSLAAGGPFYNGGAGAGIIVDGDQATSFSENDVGHNGSAQVYGGLQWSGARALSRYRVRGHSTFGFISPTPTGCLVKLQGSNDGTAWTDLDTGHNAASDPGTAWLDRSGSFAAYLYHRIYVGGTWGGAGGEAYIADVEFYEAGGLVGLLESVSVAAAAQPDQGRVVALVDAPGVLGTDTVISMSRDGGTTFSPATMFSAGLYTGTTEVLIGSVDLSAQPAGTSMRVRADLASGAPRVVRGWYPQWS